MLKINSIIAGAVVATVFFVLLISARAEENQTKFTIVGGCRDSGSAISLATAIRDGNNDEAIVGCQGLPPLPVGLLARVLGEGGVAVTDMEVVDNITDTDGDPWIVLMVRGERNGESNVIYYFAVNTGQGA